MQKIFKKQKNYLNLLIFFIVLGFGIFSVTKSAEASFGGGSCTASAGASSCSTSVSCTYPGTACSQIPAGAWAQLYYYPDGDFGAGVLDGSVWTSSTYVYKEFTTSVGHSYSVDLVYFNSDGIIGDSGYVTVRASAASAPTGTLSSTGCKLAPSATTCPATVNYNVTTNSWNVYFWDSNSEVSTPVSGISSKTVTLTSAGTSVALYYFATDNVSQGKTDFPGTPVTYTAASAAAAPAITSVSPRSYASGSSGTSIIRGSNFSSNVTVSWNGPQTGSGSYTSSNGTSISFAVSSALTSTPGTYSIVVKNSDGQVSNTTELIVSSAPTYTPTLHINCCTDLTFSETDHPWNIYATIGVDPNNDVANEDSTSYKITNGPPNAYILWTSSQDGVTREDYCYYSGQMTNDDGNGTGHWGPSDGSVWTDNKAGSWTKTVSFTEAPPSTGGGGGFSTQGFGFGGSGSCGNGDIVDGTLGSASIDIIVEKDVNTSFTATMDDGGVDYALAVPLTLRFGGDYTAWHIRNINTKSSTPDYSIALQPWYWHTDAVTPPSYPNSRLEGYTDINGNNKDLGGGAAQQYLGDSSNVVYAGGVGAFKLHYRNTRIKVLAVDENDNPTSLSGTYTISPTSGNLPTSPSSQTGFTYKGMTKNQTYTLTYSPSVDESFIEMKVDVYDCALPTMPIWPSHPLCLTRNSTTPEMSQSLSAGAEIVYTIKIISEMPSVNIKARPGTGGTPSDGPVSIASGADAALSWTVSKATSCDLYSQVSGGSWTLIGSRLASDLPDSSAESTGSLTVSTSYQLTCTNASGSSSDAVFVDMAADTTPVSGSGSCGVSESPTRFSYGTNGGSGTIAITSSIAWTATSDVSWVHITDSSGTTITSSSGSGNGTVYYKVDPGTTSRSGTISVGCQTFTVTQSNVPYTMSEAPASTTLKQSFNGATASSTTGSYTFTVNFDNNCSYTAPSLYFKVTSGLPTNASTVDGYINNNTVNIICGWWIHAGYRDFAGEWVDYDNTTDASNGWGATGGPTKTATVKILSSSNVIPGTYNLTLSVYNASCTGAASCTPSGSAIANYPVTLVVENKTPYMVVTLPPLYPIQPGTWYHPDPVAGYNVDVAFWGIKAGSGQSTSTTASVQNGWFDTTVNWTATTDQSWCHISPSSGSVDGSSIPGGGMPKSPFTISVDAPTAAMALLPNGQNYCYITFTDQLPADGRYTHDYGSPKKVLVNYIVSHSDPSNVSAVTPASCPTPEIDLSWSPSIGFSTINGSNSQYRVFRNTTNNPAGVSLIVTAFNTSIKDNSLVSTNKYFYWIRVDADLVWTENSEDSRFYWWPDPIGLGALIPANTNASGGISPICSGTSSTTQYSLTVNKTVGGTVTSSDSSINCGTTCAINYAKDTVVTLTATQASAYWKFIGWSGDCSGVGSCTVTISSQKNVTATFSPQPLIYQEF